MPVFEYRCKDCGHVFEYFIIGSGDEHVIKCEKCGSQNVEKNFSSFATFGSSSSSSGGSSCASPSGGFT